VIVEVAFVPSLLSDGERKVCIVLDVLRATSSLVTMFAAGAEEVWLAETAAEALRCAEEWRAAGRGNVVICGEVGGLPPRGFDYGNSPSEYAKADLRGAIVVFSTTNGTRALRQLARSPLVLAGSFLNAPAAVRRAVAEAEHRELDLAIVCSGRAFGKAFNLEDAVCAGYMAGLAAQQLEAVPLSSVADRDYAGATVASATGRHYLEESAVAAQHLYNSYLCHHPSPVQAARAVLGESASGRSIERLGMGRDLDYCAQVGLSELTPRVAATEGELLKAVIDGRSA